jgi:hypothetical protein
MPRLFSWPIFYGSQDKAASTGTFFFTYKHKTFLSRAKKVPSEVWLALLCPGVETYLDTKKNIVMNIVSFLLLNYPPSMLALCWLLCCCHIVVFVFIYFVAALPTPLPPPPSARRRHHHRRRSAWRLTPATRTPTAAPPRCCTSSAGPQPNVSGSEGGEVGETMPWAIMKGWDVIPLFGGSNCLDIV